MVYVFVFVSFFVFAALLARSFSEKGFLISVSFIFFVLFCFFNPGCSRKQVLKMEGWMGRFAKN